MVRQAEGAKCPVTTIAHSHPAPSGSRADVLAEEGEDEVQNDVAQKYLACEMPNSNAADVLPFSFEGAAGSSRG